MYDNSYTTILLTQLSEWICGSRSEQVRKILQTVPTSLTYGIGAPFNMSLEEWWKLLRAGWIIWLLERTMIQGAGESLGKSTAMNIFTASPYADTFLTEPKPVLLPKLKACSGNVLTTNLASSESAIATKKRNSKDVKPYPSFETYSQTQSAGLRSRAVVTTSFLVSWNVSVTCFACTVVSRKNAHGRSTLQVCQRESPVASKSGLTTLRLNGTMCHEHSVACGAHYISYVLLLKDALY